MTATPAVEPAHIPFGNEEGGIVCVSVRIRRSMWRNESRLRIRLGFGPASGIVGEKGGVGKG